MWVPGPRSQFSEKTRFIEISGVQDEWGRHVAELSSEPQAAVRHGSARQSSGTGPCGVCRRVLWVPEPRGQFSKKTRFIEKHGVQNEGGRHVSKHSFDPSPAAVRYGRAMQSSGTGSYRDCRRVLWEAVLWGQYSGKIRFIEKPGVQDERIATWLNIVLTAPSNGTPLESQAKSMHGTVWGL